MRRRVVGGIAALVLLFSLSVVSTLKASVSVESKPLCTAGAAEVFRVSDAEAAGCNDNGCEGDGGVCGKATSGGSCWCLY